MDAYKEREYKEEKPEQTVYDHLFEMNPTVHKHLSRGGFHIDQDAKTIRLQHDKAIPHAREVTNSIMKAYDDNDHKTWKKYKLGGDDDVDYNWGHPSGVIDALEKHRKSLKR